VKSAVAVLLLGLFAWGAFTWLFYDPFEGGLDRIDRVIPSSVVFALRGSSEEILAAPFVRDRLLARPEAQDLLRSWSIEDALGSIEQQQELVNARLPSLAGKFDWRRDFFGRETVIFGSISAPGGNAPPVFRGAVATRLSRRARMAASLFKHEFARRKAEEQGGVRITRFPLYYEVDLSAVATVPEWATAWAALERDVLIVGNDRAVVVEAAHLAATGGVGSLPDRPDAGTAFSGTSTDPLRGWMDVGGCGRERAAAGRPTLGEAAALLEGLPGFATMLVDPDAVSTAQASVRFPSRDEADLEIAGVRGEGASAGFADAVAQGRTRPGAEALKEAAALAPAGSAVAAARLEVRAGALVRAAFGRFEPSVREELDKWLHEGTTSLDDLAREVDDYLEPGVSVVLERLPECDDIALGTYGADKNGKFVYPLPGLLLVLRQKASVAEGATERYLRKWLDRFKDRLETYEDLQGLPAGVRGFRFRPKFLTGERDLVRPAAAFEGDLVLVASNEGTLRRALEARAGKARDGASKPALSDFDGFEADAARCGEGQGFAFVEMGAALKMLRDGRREWATDRVQKDWVEVRRKLFNEVAISFMKGKQVVTQKEIEDEVDRRVAEAQKDQREVEFPRAEEEFVRGLKVLEDLRSLAGGLTWDSSGFRLTLTVRTAGGE
jgi:hypothetical protein